MEALSSCHSAGRVLWPLYELSQTQRRAWVPLQDPALVGRRGALSLGPLYRGSWKIAPCSSVCHLVDLYPASSILLLACLSGLSPIITIIQPCPSLFLNFFFF